MASNPPPGNLFSADSLSDLIAASLPKDASPQISTALDAVALAAHASFLAVGFRLVGLGEDHRLDGPSDAESSPPPLPAAWNASPGHYAFRYRHAQSSMEYLLKLNRMGGKAIVLAMALGDDKTTSFDVTVADFISDGNLPATPAAAADPAEARRRIADVFISVGRLSDLGSLMRLHVIQKLIPGLQKAGYEETRNGAADAASTRDRRRDPPPDARPNRPDLDPARDDRDPPWRPRPPIPLHDPTAHPRRPMPDPMPGFDDEHELLRPSWRGGAGGMGAGPRIGDRDLYPPGLGPNDPFRGGVGPGLGPMRGGGGMHPTFDDPMFGGQGQGGVGGGGGGGGGGAYDPRAPPGSRYDPIGPGAGGRGGHPRGAGMGGRPPNPFGGFGDGDFI